MVNMYLLQVWLVVVVCAGESKTLLTLLLGFSWSWPVWNILVCSILLPYSFIPLFCYVFFMFILNFSFFHLDL